MPYEYSPSLSVPFQLLSTSRTSIIRYSPSFPGNSSTSGLHLSSKILSAWVYLSWVEDREASCFKRLVASFALCHVASQANLVSLSLSSLLYICHPFCKAHISAEISPIGFHAYLMSWLLIPSITELTVVKFADLPATWVRSTAVYYTLLEAGRGTLFTSSSSDDSASLM